MNKLVTIYQMPKKDFAKWRYTDWGPNHRLIDALHTRVKCNECPDGMYFLYAPDDDTRVICNKCGATKPAPDLSDNKLPFQTYEGWRELQFFRDGIKWLFTSKETKLRTD